MDAPLELAWHAVPVDEVVKRLDTNTATGLDASEAAARLLKYGPNRLPAGKTRGPFKRFLAQFNNVLVYVLLAAGFTKLMLNLWIDAVVILGVVVINGLLGFVQEGKAEKALDSIRNMLSAEARTMRGGETRLIPAEELVPGDIVLGMDRPIVNGGIRVAVIENLDVPSLLLQRVARIRPRQELLADFLVLLIAGRSFWNYLSPIFTGISVPHLSPEQIKSFRFALPNIDEQRQIVEQVAFDNAAVQSAVERMNREISLLHEFRTRLITDVVTGKLDVREAEAKLPEEAEEPELPDEADVLSDAEEQTEVVENLEE